VNDVLSPQRGHAPEALVSAQSTSQLARFSAVGVTRAWL
jgi:hypothetical protein